MKRFHLHRKLSMKVYLRDWVFSQSQTKVTLVSGRYADSLWTELKSTFFFSTGGLISLLVCLFHSIKLITCLYRRVVFSCLAMPSVCSGYILDRERCPTSPPLLRDRLDPSSGWDNITPCRPCLSLGSDSQDLPVSQPLYVYLDPWGFVVLFTKSLLPLPRPWCRRYHCRWRCPLWRLAWSDGTGTVRPCLWESDLLSLLVRGPLRDLSDSSPAYLSTSFP